jgi:excisionase family DNA binding protein
LHFLVKQEQLTASDRPFLGRVLRVFPTSDVGVKVTRSSNANQFGTSTALAEMLNDHQVSEYLNLSVASVRRWRTVRKGPKFLKIGSAVRYKREDVDTWLNSCPGLQ